MPHGLLFQFSVIFPISGAAIHLIKIWGSQYPLLQLDDLSPLYCDPYVATLIKVPVRYYISESLTEKSLCELHFHLKCEEEKLSVS